MQSSTDRDLRQYGANKSRDDAFNGFHAKLPIKTQRKKITIHDENRLIFFLLSCFVVNQFLLCTKTTTAAASSSFILFTFDE